MRKFKLFFACLLMAVLSIGQVWAAEESVTISPSQALNDGGVEPITIVCAKGDGTSDPTISSGQLRLYQAAKGKTTGNTITFSSTYSITKIEFTFANNLTASNGSFSDGTYDSENFTWTGSANSLTLTVTGTTSGTRIYITNMVVYYETGGGSDPVAVTGVTLDQTEAEVAVGKTITLTPTVAPSNATNKAVTWESDDKDIATVEDGVVTGVAEGIATITVKTVDGEKTATCEVTVTPAPVAANYELVTDVDDLAAGDEIIIVDNTETKAISTTQANNNRPAANVTAKDNVITPGDDVQILTLGITNEHWTLYTGDGYLYASSNSSNQLKTQTTNNANGEWVISITSAGVATLTAQGTNSRNVMQYNSGSSLFACYASASQTSLKIFKKAGAPAAVAKPVISGDETFFESTTVTITCETTSATIRYTLDGTDPTKSSTEYTAPFSLTETKTVKAIAILGEEVSAIATKKFTAIQPLATMQEIFDAASTTGDYYITFSNSWVVTGVSTSGKNVYITDGTKGMILYNDGGSMGLVVGNTLSGTVKRSLKKYNGAAELEGFTTEGLTIGTASVPAVQELDAAGIEALSGVNTGSLIKISGLASEESSKYYVAGVQLYNALSTAYTNPTAGDPYTVTGVYAQYNTTKEIMPRSAEDVKKVLTPSIVITSPINVTAAETFDEITVTYSNFEDAIAAHIAFYESDGETPATYDWLDAEINADNNVGYMVAANNNTEARTAYFKVYVGDVYSNLVTVSQAAFVPDYATLPFAFDGTSSDIASTTGLTDDGVGTYGSAPYLKFAETGVYLILKINEDAGVLAFDIKGNSFSGGTFKVQTSADGIDYDDLETYTELPTTVQTEIIKLAADVRYIKWIYTEKDKGNVGLGNISVSKDTYSIAWSLGDGPEENLGVLGKMGNSDSYAKYFYKDVLYAGTYNVKLYKNGATTPTATTTLTIEQETAKKYYLLFDYNAGNNEFTATIDSSKTGEPTSVDNTDATKKAVKFIQNGQLFIELNGRIYNVQGQTVK